MQLKLNTTISKISISYGTERGDGSRAYDLKIGFKAALDEESMGQLVLGDDIAALIEKARKLGRVPPIFSSEGSLLWDNEGLACKLYLAGKEEESMPFTPAISGKPTITASTDTDGNEEIILAFNLETTLAMEDLSVLLEMFSSGSSIMIEIATPQLELAFEEDGAEDE